MHEEGRYLLYRAGFEPSLWVRALRPWIPERVTDRNGQGIDVLGIGLRTHIHTHTLSLCCGHLTQRSWGSERTSLPRPQQTRHPTRRNRPRDPRGCEKLICHSNRPIKNGVGVPGGGAAGPGPCMRHPPLPPPPPPSFER